MYIQTVKMNFFKLHVTDDYSVSVTDSTVKI
jgi:hypothetical protein